MSPRGISPSGPPPWPPPCSSPQPAIPNSVAPAMPTPPAFRKSLRLNLLSALEPPPFPPLSLLTLAPPFHFSWPLQLSFEVSQFAGEGRTEPRKSFGVVARGIRLEPDGSGVADALECEGNGRIVDLTCARLTAPRHVGQLHLTDRLTRALDQGYEVSLADLGVVEIEHHPHVRAVDRLDERQRVLGAGERHPGMVDHRVEVLEAVRDPGPFAEPGQFLQCAQGGEPHLAADPEHRLGGFALNELGRVHDQAGTAQLGSHVQRLLGRLQKGPCGVGLNDVAVEVAGHGGESRTRGRQRLDVLALREPYLHGEAEFVDPAHPFLERQVQENHLGADGQRERRLGRRRAVFGTTHHFSTSSGRTGRPLFTDSMAASAISRALLASSPVQSGLLPLRTHSTKCASSLV